MKLVFLYGQPASGKLTVARALAERTGLALFHNHLVVDAVAAVFPFGSEPFVALREQFWLDMFGEAARQGRSLVFTFAPEPTVGAGFAGHARAAVEAAGGEIAFVRLTVPPGEQARRLVAAERARFGKLTSTALLAKLQAGFDACEAAMPEPVLTVDTSAHAPEAAARLIAERLGLAPAVGE